MKVILCKSNQKYKPYEFVPQGGGDPINGHRCPGESITVEIMKATLDFLVNRIHYKVPKQNLKYKIFNIPTLPNSRFIINKVTGC